MLARHESMSRKPRSVAENVRALEATIMSCCDNSKVFPRR